MLYAIMRDSMVVSIWYIWYSPDIQHAKKNFLLIFMSKIEFFEVNKLKIYFEWKINHKRISILEHEIQLFVENNTCAHEKSLSKGKLKVKKLQFIFIFRKWMGKNQQVSSLTAHTKAGCACMYISQWIKCFNYSAQVECERSQEIEKYPFNNEFLMSGDGTLWQILKSCIYLLHWRSPEIIEKDVFERCMWP